MKDCNQCGKCCLRYGGGDLHATESEIADWQENHPEIFAFVKQGAIWVDPTSGQTMQRCPWLQQSGPTEKYTCAIYNERPEDCRQYPVLLTDMIRDACEMLEKNDYHQTRQAHKALENIMFEERARLT